ncbi:hypothetical protein [Methylobacterium oryzae]|uniref:Uncharacterized protein n=1 Tax=Methylobacterium oryzae TaxID=334852 RepID=A0ABU7TKL5_9HYPH
MTPTNALSLVRSLASDEATCEFYKPVLDELRRYGLDNHELLGIVCTELGETRCYDTKPTEKYHPTTVPDYWNARKAPPFKAGMDSAGGASRLAFVPALF